MTTFSYWTNEAVLFNYKEIGRFRCNDWVIQESILKEINALFIFYD
jgi:hypothetical protein